MKRLSAKLPVLEAVSEAKFTLCLKAYGLLVKFTIRLIHGEKNTRLL